MHEATLRNIAAASLVIGAILGIAGTFVPSPELRSLAWGIDGTLLVTGSALLTVHHLHRGNELLAAGFLVFLAGETLIVSGSAVALAASAPVFAAGAALWAAGMGLVSASPAMPGLVRVTGAIGAALLAVTAVQIFLGGALDPLTRPLPFFAYPFLGLTLIGWAWTHARPQR